MKTGESQSLLQALAQEKFANERSMRAHQFIENIVEARENGFDVCCTACGVGIHDESDEHEPWCPQRVEFDQTS